jgi:hypothetical protein
VVGARQAGDLVEMLLVRPRLEQAEPGGAEQHDLEQQDLGEVLLERERERQHGRHDVDEHDHDHEPQRVGDRGEDERQEERGDQRRRRVVLDRDGRGDDRDERAAPGDEERHDQPPARHQLEREQRGGRGDRHRERVDEQQLRAVGPVERQQEEDGDPRRQEHADDRARAHAQPQGGEILLPGSHHSE